MKKILALLLAAIMVLSLAACAGTNNPSTTGGNKPADSKPADSDKDTVTEITLKVWSPAEDQVEGGWLVKMEEQFAAARFRAK